LFILLLFAFVVMHEYGHALTARKFGIKTRDITLYPIGGVARLERMPEKPIEELWVALAGPAVNVVVAALLFAYLLFTRTLRTADQPVHLDRFAGRAADGGQPVAGRVQPDPRLPDGRWARAAGAARLALEYVQATQIAANVGQGFALMFGFIGLFSNPFLVFIGLFVWMGASQEASMVQMKYSLSGIPVTRAMMTNFSVLSPQTRYRASSA
jgi:Zn-dependent protease